MDGDGRERIVRRLAREHPSISPSRLKRAVLDGQVQVDGVLVDDPGAFVAPSSKVDWSPDRPVRRHVKTSLEVLFEDHDAIAVVKPAGVLTHPTEAKEKDSLLSRVSAYAAKRKGGRAYVAVVHRLDKETSGILVFATSRAGLVTLQAQLRTHTMERVYTAVVEGNVTGEKGVFDSALVLDRGDRRRGVARDGQEGVAAVTEWQVRERFGIATLVEARLKTGRTHQVRVHFASAGHPLVGDRVYRDPRRPPFPIAFERQALHAGRLGFTTPSGELVRLETPPPEDFEALVAALKRRGRR
jgi:23S rRNA pseudouridine1911/1915/1917 synthase